MSANKSNENIVVHKGAPAKRDESGFVKIFIGLAIILSLIILVFGSALDQFTQDLYATGYGVSWSTALSGLVVASLVSAVQSWIFRHNIQENNRIWYIVSGAVGGFIGGLLAGAFRLPDSYFSGGFILGGLLGVFAGAISSLAQDLFMTSKELKQKWFVYSFVSWGIICAFGWGISWAIHTSLGTAIGAAIVVIASGFALSLFFGNSTIEF